MANKETIGARIRRLRKTTTELNQAELARAIGIHSATLNQIEKGRRQPSQDTLEKLAERLDVSIDMLVKGAHEKTSEPQGPTGTHAETREARPTENSPPAYRPEIGQAFDFSSAIRREVFAAVAAIFADAAASLAARATAEPTREAAPLRRSAAGRAGNR